MTRGCASFLCALWALLACSWAAAHNASNADLLLAGELQEGFIRYLLFPNVLNEPETTWSTWCGTRRLGDLGTGGYAVRVNRCLANSVNELSFLLQLGNSELQGPFLMVQTNTSHHQVSSCDDALCSQNCTTFLASRKCGEIRVQYGSFDVGVVLEWDYEPTPFVLPSPSFCTRIHASMNCTNEILAQFCFGQCFGTPTGLARLDCSFDSALGDSTRLSTCQGLEALSCSSATCSGPPPFDFRREERAQGCSLSPGSPYGYFTLGCTVGASSDTLLAHACAGLNGTSADAQCLTDGSVVLDASDRSIRVAGSWTTPDSRLTIQDPPGTAPVLVLRGSFAPNGELRVSFRSNQTRDSATFPIVVVTFTDGLLLNAQHESRFTNVIIETAGSQTCTGEIETTSTSVLLLGCEDQGGQGSLSRGALAGIIVGSILGGVLLALTIVVVSKYATARNTQRMQKQLNDRDMEMLSTHKGNLNLNQ